MTAEEETELAALRSKVRSLNAALASTKNQLRKAYTSRARIHARLISITRRLGKYEAVQPPDPLPEPPGD